MRSSSIVRTVLYIDDNLNTEICSCTLRSRPQINVKTLDNSFVTGQFRRELKRLHLTVVVNNTWADYWGSSYY